VDRTGAPLRRAATFRVLPEHPLHPVEPRRCALPNAFDYSDAVESVAKLVRHGATHHVGWGIAAAVIGIAGNQLVARYKLVVGRRIQSATMIADAKHSWLDALSSGGALLGLVGVAAGWGWADGVAETRGAPASANIGLWELPVIAARWLAANLCHFSLITRE